MIATGPLTRDLLRRLAARSRDRFAGALAGTPQGEALALRVDGWAEAAFLENHPVAAYGLFPIWAGRVEAWALVCTGISSHTIGRICVKGCGFLDRLQRTQPHLVHRIEMWCPADAPWCHSFGRALGFREEGIARAYGPDGADYTLFARLAEDVR